MHLFHYFEYRYIIDKNPFNKVQICFREPKILPKTIPLNFVESLLTIIYQQKNTAKTHYQRKNALRDAATNELLFATGIRISELCSLKPESVDLNTWVILIFGKGFKERIIQIKNENKIKILLEYRHDFPMKYNTKLHSTPLNRVEY